MQPPAKDPRSPEQKMAARQVLQFTVSICVPVFWKRRADDGNWEIRNGTAFFLRTPEAVFGVTAMHVVERGWRIDRETREAAALQMGATAGLSLPLPWDARCVDVHEEIDIATFMVTEREVAALGKSMLRCVEWPPRPPERDDDVAYAGYPGGGTRMASVAEVDFGALTSTGIVHAVNERSVSSQIEREFLAPAFGEGLPPENFDFGGISGGPMLFRSSSGRRDVPPALGGVIIEGPSTDLEPGKSIAGFELIRARHARFLKADGSLDVDAWNDLKV